MRPELLIAFENAWPRHDGHKETAIRRELGITPARYYQLLGRAAHSLEGIAAHPVTARRVRERTFRTMGYTVGYTAATGRNNEKGPSSVEA